MGGKGKPEGEGPKTRGKERREGRISGRRGARWEVGRGKEGGRKG